MTTEQLQVFTRQNGLVFLGKGIRVDGTDTFIGSASRAGNKITAIAMGIAATPNQRKLLQAFCLIHGVPFS